MNKSFGSKKGKEVFYGFFFSIKTIAAPISASKMNKPDMAGMKYIFCYNLEGRLVFFQTKNLLVLFIDISLGGLCFKTTMGAKNI